MEKFLAKAEDAEIALLSCLRASLLETGATVSRCGVAAKHFASERGEAFTCLMEFWREGLPADFVTLCNRLSSRGVLIDKHMIRGWLFEPVPPSMAATYCATLLECHAARRLHEIGVRLSGAAFDTTTDTNGLLAEARNALGDLSVHSQRQETSLHHFLKGVLADMEGEAVAENVIEFGLGLDDKAGPFCRTDLVVIGGQTKHGKSALAGNIVENVAAKGHRCLIFSLEMSGKQNAERMLASQGRLDTRSYKLRRRFRKEEMDFTQQDMDDMDKMERALKAMEGWKVDIYPGVDSLNSIVSEMMRVHSSGGLDLTVVDYAQLVEGNTEKGEKREREVASVGRALKRAAAATNSLVILLSQLNDDGRLRESRAIGQDANCVLFIDGEADKRTIRVGAARSAPTGTEIEMRWQPTFTRFSEPI